MGCAGQINEEGNAANGSNKQELLCGGCSAHQAGSKCARHGSEFTEWKCRYCCTIASFFCFGTTHMCNACHEKWQLRPGCLSVSRRSCTPLSCPLHTAHPDHGHEHCLGCALCRTNDWYHIQWHGHVSNECFTLMTQMKLIKWNRHVVLNGLYHHGMPAGHDWTGTVTTWFITKTKVYPWCLHNNTVMITFALAIYYKDGSATDIKWRCLESMTYIQ